VTLRSLLGPELPGAACKGRGGLWDDIVDGETTGQRTERHEKAQAICAACPARAACLRARFEHPRLLGAGIWGGRQFTSRKRECRSCQRCGDPTPSGKSNYCDTCRTTAVAEHVEGLRGQRRVALPGLNRCQGCDGELKGDTRRRSCSTTCRKRASERRRQQRKAAA
jgi:transcription factor WhiB